MWKNQLASQSVPLKAGTDESPWKRAVNIFPLTIPWLCLHQVVSSRCRNYWCSHSPVMRELKLAGPTNATKGFPSVMSSMALYALQFRVPSSPTSSRMQQWSLQNKSNRGWACSFTTLHQVSGCSCLEVKVLRWCWSLHDTSTTSQ